MSMFVICLYSSVFVEDCDQGLYECIDMWSDNFWRLSKGIFNHTIASFFFTVISSSASVRSVGSTASRSVVRSISPRGVRKPRAVSEFSEPGGLENTLHKIRSQKGSQRRPRSQCTSSQVRGSRRRLRCPCTSRQVKKGQPALPQVSGQWTGKRDPRNIVSYWAKRLQTQIFLRRKFTRILLIKIHHGKHIIWDIFT